MLAEGIGLGVGIELVYGWWVGESVYDSVVYLSNDARRYKDDEEYFHMSLRLCSWP